jgi:hypothetical protein
VRGAERFVALLEPYLAKPLDEPAKKELEKALLDL